MPAKTKYDYTICTPGGVTARLTYGDGAYSIEAGDVDLAERVASAIIDADRRAREDRLVCATLNRSQAQAAERRLAGHLELDVPLVPRQHADETVLQEAAKLTAGDRQAAYGHPLDNHGLTAVLWSRWLERHLGRPITLSPEDVCYLNVLQKLSREAHLPKRDNLVDVCGYLRNVEMIQEERRKRGKETPE